jgi:tetratricopeptide (TPR) repeat protein
MRYNVFGYIFVMLVMVSSCVFGGEQDATLFGQANAYYKQGKFDQALEAYSQIADKNSQVYFNLGNCAFKLKRHGYALLYWRKAERDWGIFNRQELLENISLVRKTTTESDQSVVRQGPIFAMLHAIQNWKNNCASLIRATPLLIFQVLFLLMWLFLFGFLRMLYRKKHTILIWCLFFLMASSGSLLVLKYSFNFRTFGVVVSQKVSLFSGPGENYQRLGTLPEAQELVIQRESDDYYKIKIGRQIGWVNKKYIQTV